MYTLHWAGGNAKCGINDFIEFQSVLKVKDKVLRLNYITDSVIVDFVIHIADSDYFNYKQKISILNTDFLSDNNKCYCVLYMVITEILVCFENNVEKLYVGKQLSGSKGICL